MTRPPEKFYVFKLRGRWCAVQQTSKETAVAWARHVINEYPSDGAGAYCMTHGEALQRALTYVGLL